MSLAEVRHTGLGAHIFLSLFSLQACQGQCEATAFCSRVSIQTGCVGTRAEPWHAIARSAALKAPLSPAGRAEPRRASRLLPLRPAGAMSEVEETINRIRTHKASAGWWAGGRLLGAVSSG